MRAHVLVFPQRGEGLLAAWTYYSGHAPARQTFGAGGWESFCEEEVRRALRGDRAGASAFICLLGDGLAVTPDVHLLNRILTDIRTFGWAPQIYLVAPKRQPADCVLEENRAGIEAFFETGLRSRVQNLLQISFNPRSGEEEDPAFLGGTELWRAANRVLSFRQIRSRQTAPSAVRLPWRCLFPEETVLLGQAEGPSRLLRDLVQPWDEDLDGNLLVLVDSQISGAERQVRALERARERFGEHGMVVATLRTSASSALLRCCRAHRLDATLSLEGTLELWFLLLRLNQKPPVDQAVAPEWFRLVEPVQLDGQRAPATSGSILHRPSLLISSAFDPVECGHCHAASADAGTLLQLAPLDLPYVVTRTLNPQRLAEVLADDDPPRIWIHAGHGDGQRGLQASPLGQFFDVDAWLACLRARNVPLDLVLLLTCDSALIARRFAQVGVGVAVGFDGEVPTAAPGRLAEEILRAVFARGLTAATALDGFLRGVDLLRATFGSSSAEPRAYYSVWP